VISFEKVMAYTNRISSHTALEDEEARAMFDLCYTEIPAAGFVVEVGCELGRSSSIIAQVGKYVGYKSAHIDPYLANRDYLVNWISMMHDIGNPFVFYSMPSQLASGLLPRKRFDLVYIDGDHEYEAVRMDLALIASNVRSKGLLLAHDYGRDSLPGPKPAVDEFVSKGWSKIGVYGTLGVWRRT